MRNQAIRKTDAPSDTTTKNQRCQPAASLRKLNAARGGGFIVQSDHSVPDTVDPATDDYVVELVRRHGAYPLDLAEFDAR